MQNYPACKELEKMGTICLNYFTKTRILDPTSKTLLFPIIITAWVPPGGWPSGDL